jgi:NAD(P)-dependent dehydrogenase (short-subunit alcohol dehydrogenase family)
MSNKAQHVVIIGGSSPLGLACANAFVFSGKFVSIVCSQTSSAFDFKTDKIQAYKYDLEKLDSITAFFSQLRSEHGEVTTLIFFQRYRGSGDLWDGEYAVSLRATQILIDEFSAQPFKANSSVVIISSPAATKVALEQPLSYHVAKAALSQIVRYYAVALGPLGIRVNGVQPAIVFKERAATFYEQHPELVQLYQRITPLGRMGSPKDIAGAVIFLCSNPAGFITGQVLVVDGGLSLHEAASLSRLSNNLDHIPLKNRTILSNNGDD